MGTIVVPGPSGTDPTIVTEHTEHHRDHEHSHREYWEHGSDRRVERQAAENFGSVTRQSAEVEARLGVQAALNAKDGIIEAGRNFSSLSVQATLNAKDGVIEATKNAAAVSLQIATTTAATNALINQRFAETDAQIAECCCEGKELARALAAELKDRMDQIQATNLATQLTDSKLEVAALRARLTTVTAT